MSFVLKSVNAEGGLGPDLKELRERAGLTVAQASQRTKILESLIRTWEEDRWKDISDPVYSERIFKSYVATLGGAGSYFLDKYRSALAARDIKPDPEEYLPRIHNVPTFDLAVGARVRTLAIFALFVTLIVGYVVVQVRSISIPPPLEITAPADGAELTGPRLIVTGRTLPNAGVTVNELPVVVQPDGSFSLELDVPRGTTLVTITAKKRYGREITVTRRVVYDRALPTQE